MASIHDVNPTELIEKASEALAQNDAITAPEWAAFVKTGRHKERIPSRKDWWEVRAAAVLRTIYRQGPIGVSKLRIKYGGKKRRGHKPAHFYIASGNILRKILQQLEKAGFVKQDQRSGYKGRVITPQGKSFLDKIATELHKRKKPSSVKPQPESKQVDEKKGKPAEEVNDKKEENVKKDSTPTPEVPKEAPTQNIENTKEPAPKAEDTKEKPKQN